MNAPPVKIDKICDWKVWQPNSLRLCVAEAHHEAIFQEEGFYTSASYLQSDGETSFKDFTICVRVMVYHFRGVYGTLVSYSLADGANAILIGEPLDWQSTTAFDKVSWFSSFRLPYGHADVGIRTTALLPLQINHRRVRGGESIQFCISGKLFSYYYPSKTQEQISITWVVLYSYTPCLYFSDLAIFLLQLPDYQGQQQGQH